MSPVRDVLCSALERPPRVQHVPESFLWATGELVRQPHLCGPVSPNPASVTSLHTSDCPVCAVLGPVACEKGDRGTEQADPG